MLGTLVLALALKTSSDTTRGISDGKDRSEAVWGLQISRWMGPGGRRESFKPESLKRFKKKEIKSKLNAAALPLATSFSVELIQECFEFQLCLQRRRRVTVFEIQATAQGVPPAFTQITVGTPSPALLPGQPREVYKPRHPQEALPTTHLINTNTWRCTTAME